LEANCFDVVVIGSGFGGAVATCRLTQAGFRVLLLERGRRYEEGDFPPLPTSDSMLPDLRRWAWGSNQGLWDIEDLQEIVSVQAAGYGGGSLIYANVHLRPPASVFDSHWPEELQGRVGLDHFFDLAAHMLDVSPVEEDAYPKTKRLHGVAKALGRGSDFFRPPLAVNFRPKINAFGQEQQGCNGCGKCCTGCPRRAKNSLDLNYLAAAERGGARVYTQSEVTRIVQHDGGPDAGDRRWTIKYTDHLSASTQVVHAGNVFLCAGALHSTRLLAGASLLPRSRAVKSRVGIGYFPNADAGAIVYDTAEELNPSHGPAITTSTVHWKERSDFFIIQDGGYAPELERLMGMLRAPLWGGRNRLSAASSGGPADRARAKPRLASVPLPSPLDAILDAVAGGALSRVVPDQLKKGWPSVLEDAERLLLLPPAVDVTIERALRARQEIAWPMRWFDVDGWLCRALRWTSKVLARWALGRSPVIADHALRALLGASDLGRAQLGRDVLGYDSGKPLRRMMLLAMGRDASPGVLLYDPCTKRLTADLDLYRLSQGYSNEERLMNDMARELRGELRVNPAFALLGTPITVHSQGGCRMSVLPEHGVTQPNGEVHGCPGLYVMDGSVLCQSVGVNPSATILALAERNVLGFIRTKKPNWPDNCSSPGAKEYRQHAHGAKEWKRRAQLAGWEIEPPFREPSVKIVSEPLGISFTEQMQGYCAPLLEGEDPMMDDARYRILETRGRPGNPVLLQLDAKIADLSVFIEDYTHRIDLSGTVELILPGRVSADTFPVSGRLELFVPRYKPYGLQDPKAIAAQRAAAEDYTTRVGRPGPRLARLMRYYLSFDEDRWRLEGYKRMRQDPGVDAWRDTSSLFTRIGTPRRDANDNAQPLGEKDSIDVKAAGVVHVDLMGLLYDQLPSFKATGVGDPCKDEVDAARATWAVSKFAGFFFGTLQRIYVPETKAALATLFDPRANQVRHEAPRRRYQP
jgi:choline dehydrogenase-like flavoprotein